MALKVFFKTLPYVLMRALVFAIFGLGMLIFLGIIFLIGLLLNSIFKNSPWPMLILAVIALGSVIGITRLAQRYVLYLVKVGHVAVITELVTVGELPAGTNQFSYGKDKVVKHFGSASALFVVDQLVSVAVRQILNWLGQAASCLGQIPGVNAIVSIIRAILQVAGNYVDESVMSYILQHEDQDVWQAAADGLVLYAQNWKKLLLTATVLALIIALLGAGIFLIVFLPFLALAQAQTEAAQPLYYMVGLVLALIISAIFKWIVVDPLATVGMVVSYNQAIKGETPAVDLSDKLASVSGKFRSIRDRAGSGQTQPLDQTGSGLPQ
jgi:hypothetical protein